MFPSGVQLLGGEIEGDSHQAERRQSRLDEAFGHECVD
jgi:hypothetical protein